MKKYILAIACLLSAMTGFAQDALTVEDAAIKAGEAGELNIILSNPGQQYIACQFDIDVPAGLTIPKNARGSFAANTSYTIPERADGFVVGITEQGDNHYRVTMYNNDNYDFMNQSGAILVLKVKAEETFVGGAGKIYEIVLTNANRESVKPEAAQFAIAETTGISNVEKAEQKGGTIYNLAGQKVSKAQKGVFIQNGRKVVMK